MIKLFFRIFWLFFIVLTMKKLDLLTKYSYLIIIFTFDIISSIYFLKVCSNRIKHYNLITLRNNHQALSLFRTSSSQVNIFNFSYQPYPEQHNKIENRAVQLINAI